MSPIKPYCISISPEKIDDLKLRLRNARLPDEPDEAGWDLGAPVSEVSRFLAYWRDHFDWASAERKLNHLPHFTTEIEVAGFDPLNIHFLHQPSPVPNAIPLLYVHGWPGSFLEGSKIIQNLSGDGISDPAFHVVGISLPNFGFSEGPKKRGFALEQYAETCQNLMQKLGYSEYVTQGGDWGYYITRTMALLYPHSVKATHINFDYGGSAPTFWKYPLLAIEHAVTPYTEREKKGLERRKWFAEESSGYRSLQATKPTTPAYALADSPVALLAWLYEKLHDWSDNYPWTEEEVCTWISIYWFSTAGPGASLRIYYESTHDWKNSGPNKVTRARTSEWIGSVKLGYSHLPMELRNVPSTWTRKLGPTVFDRQNDRGGHFFAWEVPESLIKDVRDMFRTGGGAHGVVPGHNGYIS
ncbi:Alpha/Beta hydrolase protein [Penicillium paradoxum]|uniref:Alpha/Beta hydrolase protein n=1 Tax=Penicillium paradoxum TaxID=176176 RepID=UPI0025494097|nr:Alpha/Beta hydrolase protein [Penicillium paradoxum]KAJ5774829.1 Alpha/Beta hydrolase protein [Penicillium paradoxum]